MNNKGMALLIALTSMTIMIGVALEISFDSNVEYLVAARRLKHIEAKAAARAGLELSLLRLRLYREAVQALRSSVGEQAVQMLEPIWKLPMTWPPPTPENLSIVDRDMIQSAIKETLMTAQYVTDIQSESGLININLLGFEVEEVAQNTRRQILQIFEQERINNSEFNEKYRNTNFEELVNNLADWVDIDTESRNGGAENRFYQAVVPRDSQAAWPPNLAFKSLSELSLVAGMRDDFMDLLTSRTTVFGSLAVNINQATRSTLKALGPNLTDEQLDQIMNARDSQNQDQGQGPFADENAFFDFLQQQGINPNLFNPAGVLLSFGAETHFRVSSTGLVGNVQAQIDVRVFDLEQTAAQYASALYAAEQDQSTAGQSPQETPQPPANPTGRGDGTSQDAQQEKNVIDPPPPPNQKPLIIDWQEL